MEVIIPRAGYYYRGNFETKARILAKRHRRWLLATSLSKEWWRVLFFNIPVASKENDRESDRPCFSTLIPSTAQNDQSDTATYYDE